MTGIENEDEVRQHVDGALKARPKGRFNRVPFGRGKRKRHVKHRDKEFSG